MRFIKEIDGLRFIAIFLVLCQHFATTIGDFFSAGYYGVDLFFVISGFLITGILLETKGSFWQDYRKFIGRRTLRIFPIYYLTILLLVLFRNPYVWDSLVYCLTYTFNYAWVNRGFPNESPLIHLWSLSVEEQFYLIWPFIVLGFRKRPRLFVGIAVFVILICAVQLQFCLFSKVTPYNKAGLFPRAYSLCMGALGSVLLRSEFKKHTLLRNYALEIAVYIVLLAFLVSDLSIKPVVLPVISLFLVLKAATGSYQAGIVKKLLVHPLVLSIGAVSYGIYLFHLPLEYYLTKYLFDPFFWNKIDFHAGIVPEKLQWNSWIIKLPLYGALTYMVAKISYRFIEKPILNLKDNWFKY